MTEDQTPTPEERLQAAAEADEQARILGTERRPTAAGQGPGSVPDERPHDDRNRQMGVSAGGSGSGGTPGPGQLE
jgi:hypothetical protein